MPRLRQAVLLLLLCAQAVAAPPERTLRIGLVSLPASLGNPYRENNIPGIYTICAMFDGLTRFDKDGVLQPWLALSWDQRAPLEWVFTLRPGVTFQNGKPFDAASVVAAIGFLTSDAAKREPVARELADIAGAEALGPLTVLIRTRRPAPLLPRSLPILYIPEPESFARLGPETFAQAPIGTGAFKLERWEANRAVLTAYKQAWRPAHVDALELMALPQADTRVEALNAGEIDVGVALGPDDLASVVSHGGQGVSWHVPGVMGVAFVTNKGGPLADVRVRQALNLAVDRQAIVDALLAGAVRPAHGVAAPGTIGFDPSVPPIPYDPARAKALLAEAGYPNGFRMAIEAVIGGGANDAAMYQQVASDFRKVGVIMEIRIIPIQKLLHNVSFGGWEGEGFGMSYDAEPSDDVLRAIRVHSCLWRVPWHCDKALMPRIEAALSEPDADRREALTREIVAATREAAPHLSLYELPRFAGLSARLRHFSEVNGFIDYAAMELDPGG